MQPIYLTYKLKWDYELLDSGNGNRLEQWGNFKLVRPDPQAIWQPHLSEKQWQQADAIFHNDKWQIKTHIPAPIIITWNNLKLLGKLTPFKHTGIFAEQAANWEWLQKQATTQVSSVKNSSLKILNLFGYTGAATTLLASLGCQVTHVDASKQAIAWAKENQKLNHLPENSVRWILDDAGKFIKREIKRSVEYDGIIMDPPAFGHSPTGQTWKFTADFPKLLIDCARLLSKKAKFLLINSYATNSSPLALQNITEDAMKNRPSHIESGELCLAQTDGRLLSTGVFTRWTNTIK